MFFVRIIDFFNIFRNICKERNDEWFEIVLRRFNIVLLDMYVVDVIYY